MLAMFIPQITPIQPINVIVQQPIGWPVWQTTLFSAAIGAILGIAGNVTMEFLKPRIGNFVSRQEVSKQLVIEVTRNLSYLEKVRILLRAANRGEAMNKEHAKYLLSNIWDDRYRHYLADKPILVFEIDRHKQLREFYQMASADLPSAIAKGGVCESVAGPGTASEIIEWVMHWGEMFVTFQSRPLKLRLKFWWEDRMDRWRAKT
jgi:hypothetical protein